MSGVGKEWADKELYYKKKRQKAINNKKYQSDRDGRYSALLPLPEEVFHTTVILDPGAGPRIY